MQARILALVASTAAVALIGAGCGDDDVRRPDDDAGMGGSGGSGMGGSGGSGMGGSGGSGMGGSGGSMDAGMDAAAGSGGSTEDAGMMDSGMMDSGMMDGSMVDASVCAANPGGTLCDGDTLITCGQDGGIGETTECALGCDDTGDATCLAMVPSNLPQDTCTPTGSETSLTADEDVMVDTDNDGDCNGGVITKAESPDICVMRYSDLTVQDGVRVRATGGRALAVVTTGSMTINGTIDASSDTVLDEGTYSHIVGPGSVADGMGGAGNTTSDGGGGAGNATTGQPGGLAEALDGNGAGAAGESFGNTSVEPLRGGSAGGSNSDGAALKALPGDGGGALQLVACGSLEIGSTGVIDAGGGGGEGGRGSGALAISPGGGAGGGSGGAILIESPSVMVADGAVLAANGGAGGGGGAEGTATSSGADGFPGANASATTAAATGGNGVPSAASGDGGNGGVEGTEPTSGENHVDSQGAAGGGGGAVGRIRINVRSGTQPDDDNATMSPEASVGTVGTTS